MSSWKSGRFEKDRIPSMLHALTPAHAVDNLHSIDLNQLWESGKRLLLLDVDNTLVQWKQETFSDPIVKWIAQAKELGFGICLVSNTNHLERLERLSQSLGVETVRGRFKPSRAMFRLAMMKFGCRPEQTIMVGDQLMTDILGANRAGLEAYWVRKMEGEEFAGTSLINRRIERLFQSLIYRALVAPLDESPRDDATKDLPERTIVHQIVRFLIVGGSSFIIDSAIKWMLMFVVPAGATLLSIKTGHWLRGAFPDIFNYAETDQKAFLPIASTISASVAILNSFFWNRFWTFEIRGTAERARQLRRFVAVSLVGLLINVSLTSFFYHVLPLPSKPNLVVATILAAGFAAVWNFTSIRLYAFRAKRAT